LKSKLTSTQKNWAEKEGQIKRGPKNTVDQSVENTNAAHFARAKPSQKEKEQKNVPRTLRIFARILLGEGIYSGKPGVSCLKNQDYPSLGIEETYSEEEGGLKKRGSSSTMQRPAAHSDKA